VAVHEQRLLADQNARTQERNADRPGRDATGPQRCRVAEGRRLTGGRPRTDIIAQSPGRSRWVEQEFAKGFGDCADPKVIDPDHEIVRAVYLV
jgi:hypothetical protein